MGCESTELLVDFRWMGFCSLFAYISLMSGYLRGSIGNGYAFNIILISFSSSLLAPPPFFRNESISLLTQGEEIGCCVSKH